MRQPGRPKKFPGVVAYAPPSQIEEPRSPESWLQEGIDNGWCTGWYCENHDAYAFEDGDEFAALYEEYDSRDFCWNVVRIKVPMPQGTRAGP